MDQSTVSGPAVSDTYPREATAIYHPLRANETRFLRLFPATSWDDEIHSELMHVPLEDDDDSNALSSYEALSYTWGTRDLAHGIWIKNSKSKITANLFQALLHLRDRTKIRTLWIDAICVNQENLRERSQQIQYMQRIYSSVQQVIIWLGEEAEGVDSVSCLLSKEVDKLTQIEIQAVARTLFQRPWWCRSWTVQEFINSKNCTFHYGSIKIAWKDMVEIMEVSHNIVKNSNFYQYLRSKNNHGNDTLRTVMFDFGHCDASDPRDKIYAFLGIAQDGHLIMPDYNASVQQVYTDVVKAYVKNERNLEIICTHHRGQSAISLPSWVPDWSICRNSDRNWTVNNHGWPFYCAGYFQRSSSSLQSDKSPSVYGISIEDSHTLYTTGTTVGMISWMSHKIDMNIFDSNQWIQSILSWKMEAVPLGEYINGETNFCAFCRTLVGDTVGFSSAANKNYAVLNKIEKWFRAIFENPSDPLIAVSPEEFKKLRKYVQRAICDLKFASISSGYMALVPEASKVGDEICVLLGSSTPMVMRRKLHPLPTINSSPAGVHEMVGPCYVHGVMTGEMAETALESFAIQ